MRRRAFVEVDGVYIAFDDVDKANGIGFFQDGGLHLDRRRV
jgi:hypothetical protein